MRIGVFGDSFAREFEATRHFAWFNLLAQKLGGRVSNDYQYDRSYGLGGASVFYSYKKFLKAYKKFDYVFFIAGDPYRYTQFINDNITVPNISTVDAYLVKDDTPDYAKEELEKIKAWFLVSDHEFLDTAQELMLNDIEQRMSKERVLILPSLRYKSLTKERKERMNMDFGLTDYMHIIHKSLDVPPDKWQHEPYDKICCHMTEEANVMLADMLYEYMANGKRLELPSHIPHKHDWTYYYTGPK